MSADVWEQLRRVTLDELVTSVKLQGSAVQVNGFTTPEGYPFSIVVAVAKPGNEKAVELANEFHKKMSKLAPTKAAENPRNKR